MQETLAVRSGARERSAVWNAVLWRVSNPLLAALIGGVAAGANGAAIGFYFGVLLVLAPGFVQRTPFWMRRLYKFSAPLRARIWRALPSRLRIAIEERRGQ